MEPLISKGDIISISCDKRARPGDIIFFKTKKMNLLVDGKSKNIEHMVHRVVGKIRKGGKRCIIHKGDSLNLSFFYADHDDVIGKVCSIEKPEGRIDLDSAAWKTADFCLAANALIEYRVSRYMYGLSGKLKMQRYCRNILSKLKRIDNILLRAYLRAMLLLLRTK